MSSGLSRLLTVCRSAAVLPGMAVSDGGGAVVRSRTRLAWFSSLPAGIGVVSGGIAQGGRLVAGSPTR